MNPYDERNIRSRDFRCGATMRRNSDKFTLTLTVSDGPQVWADFDLTEEIDNWGENSLTAAVAKTANALIEEAQRDEAGHWIADHETCYLVQGLTGHQCWSVKAFASQERAEDFCHELNQWCIDKQLDYGAYVDPVRRRIVDPHGDVAKCPHDPGFRIEPTGTRYVIVPVPLDMFDPIREG